MNRVKVFLVSAIVGLIALLFTCNSCVSTTKRPRNKRIHMEYFPPYYYEHYYYSPYYWYSPIQRPRIIQPINRPHRQGSVMYRSRRR